MPSASTTEAMVEAVPITMQWPFERCMQPSASLSCSSVMLPARRSAKRRHTSVPEPSFSPHHSPRSIGPPVSMSVGRSADAAPMSMAGVVLSHPDRSTTASIG
jgi:hypothetical protein